jgi:hypothetical protein
MILTTYINLYILSKIVEIILFNILYKIFPIYFNTILEEIIEDTKNKHIFTNLKVIT